MKVIFIAIIALLVITPFVDSESEACSCKTEYRSSDDIARSLIPFFILTTVILIAIILVWKNPF